jgi:hypothetical protein
VVVGPFVASTSGYTVPIYKCERENVALMVSYVLMSSVGQGEAEPGADREQAGPAVQRAQAPGQGGADAQEAQG